ncbi:MAG TPA: hypothetical protein VGV07_11210 [Devosia sp.]|jgi:molecular chaperone GrpE (heat shock protein)|uniref:hypothetical protein n=1 Tax=Devosia sp. TaxID=1871048 RepID=UPI002DDD86D0|nr:hypothetical protein [Devosia sp.]HEV2515810.1 hypothetical protein [Devosia sp.]
MALKDGQTSIIPDLVIRAFLRQGEAIRSLTKSTTNHASSVDEFGRDALREIAEVKESLAIFSSSLSMKDQEIDRLRKGGDAKIFHRFLDRFVRLHRAVGEEIEDATAGGERVERLRSLLALLEDALAECGVTTFSPRVGESFRSAFGVASAPSVVATSDIALDMTVAGVISAGYALATAEGPVCLRPSSVSIYKYGTTE